MFYRELTARPYVEWESNLFLDKQSEIPDKPDLMITEWKHQSPEPSAGGGWHREYISSTQL